MKCNLECALDKETRTCIGCGRTLSEIRDAGLKAKAEKETKMIINDEKFLAAFSGNLARLHEIEHNPLGVNQLERAYYSGVCDAFKWINQERIKEETTDEN